MDLISQLTGCSIEQLVDSDIAIAALSFCGDDPLEADALLVAEKITGLGKENETTSKLCLVLHSLQSRLKEKEALTKGDTTFSMSSQDYMRVVEEIGFELVGTFPFENFDKECLSLEDVSKYRERKGRTVLDSKKQSDKYVIESVEYEECLYVHWMDGLLLYWDTHRGDRNSAHMYLNCIAGKCSPFRIQMSGGCRRLKDGAPEPKYADPNFWNVCSFFGYVDAREFLKATIQNIKNKVQILNPWRLNSQLWLLHYGDFRKAKEQGIDCDCYGITAQRVQQLPAHVRNALGVSV